MQLACPGVVGIETGPNELAGIRTTACSKQGQGRSQAIAQAAIPGYSDTGYRLNTYS
jgi:hypothetical protein